MTAVVISQPMFFPWVGMLEQIRLADVYVHLDDTQYSKGSFTNRVQIKTADGFKWLTVPVTVSLGQQIREVTPKPDPWPRSHLDLLQQSYVGAPYLEEMLALYRKACEPAAANISDISIASMEALCSYFGLASGLRCKRTSQLGIAGRSSERVLDIVRQAGGDVYITGHGARNYLDHELFERHGVEVRYIKYERKPYPQLHGEFNPHVSALDLVANAGSAGAEVICSGSVPWREFLST